MQGFHDTGTDKKELDEQFNFWGDKTKTVGEEQLFDDVEPDEFDIYPSQVTSAMHNTLDYWENYDPDLSPELSGGDIDAAWEFANFDGSETSGGSSPTPDQDIVDDLAEPWGMDYEETEELDAERKRADLERARREDEETGQP